MKNKTEFVAGIITDTHMDENTLPVVVDIFKQFLNECIERGVLYAFHLGDWFHKRSGQSLICQLATKEIIRQFQDRGIQLIVMPGNHDKTDYTSTLSYLHTYNFFEPAEHRVGQPQCPLLVDEPTFIELECAQKLLLILCPFFREDVYPVYFEQLFDLGIKTKSRKKILLTHVAVNGARNNDGSLVSGAVPASWFKEHFDFTYTGHYHNYNVVENANLTYIGNSYQLDFGEDHRKGFSFLKADGSITHIESVYKHYYKFEVPVEDKDKLRKTLKEVKPYLADHYVRIVFTGGQDELDSVDVTSLRKMGIDVKHKNTKELVIDFENIEEANLHVFNKSDIMKLYNQYTKQHNFTGKQRGQGLKLLQAITN